MENLTKQQIILLTLLISFVTSIATGIVTVALMNQAPVGVVQTINRVVEKTIQTVTAPSKEIQTVVKETVVVNPEDQIVSVVEKNSKSVIRIYRTNIDPSSGLNSMVFVGLGAVVADGGIIATDNSLISEGGKYFTTAPSDKLLDLTIVKSVTGEQVALLKINNEKDQTTFSRVSISKGDLKLGQTVIYIGGETKNAVSTGIVSSLSVKETKLADNSTSTPVITKISSIETSISSNFISGGLLLNLSGELVGIKSNYMDSPKTSFFAPSSDIQEVLSSLVSSQKKAQ
ncbi:MAG: S1C family serine protease [bacterium]